MPACPSCRRENRAEAAFCDSCGAPLRGPTGDAVRLPSRTSSGGDVFVNGTLVAHGEVVVVNEKFGIRLTDVISPAERIRKLK